MDIQPTALHQRVGVVMGERDEVEIVQAYHREAAAAQ
ncbi:MAG: hypothetical protein JWL62_2047, partial [Hyphomicrobiales bacterium]|nr:hypothetical protein [Hyphomicrobiales bacterium]